MRKTLILITILISFVGCEKEEPTPTMTGGWIGTVDGYNVDYTLTQTGNIVTGSGHTGALASSINGSCNYPSVSLTLSTQLSQP